MRPSFLMRLLSSVGILGGAWAGLAAAGEPSSPSPPDLQPFVSSPDLFPILPWDVLHGWKEPLQQPRQGLESIAQCNFTLAGFVRPEDLPLCEKLGLQAILVPAGDARPWLTKWRGMSADQVDEAVRGIVEAAGNSPAVLGYYIVDEPGSTAFPALAQAVAAVKKYAPGKLAYINLFPSYATVGAPDQSQLGTATYTDYLERFVNEVKPQILNYDNYMVQYSDDLLDQGKAAVYYADLLEVRRVAQKYRLPFWNIVSCNQIRKQTTIPSPANLAFQAYTTLAAGGRGVSWYKYYESGYAYAPVDRSDEKTPTWRDLQAVNHQLRTLGPIVNRLSSTGVFFTSPAPMKGAPQLPGRLVQEVSSTASPRGLAPIQPPILVGEFQDPQGSDCAMLVNLSLQHSAHVKLATVKSDRKKQFFSPEDGRLLPLDEENGHWLPAGHGILIQLQ
ncbi:MAG: hypothetical protein ACYC6Y_02870 [Thermoguttaceae bacterium]